MRSDQSSRCFRVCSPVIIHSCHLTLRRSLKGFLIQTSRGWRMPVIPPGIIAHSVFSDCKVLLIGLDKCGQNESHTSIDLRQLKPPTLLPTVFSQSFTSSSFIHPFSWHLTISPWGKVIFFGNVFRLNTTYGGSFVPSQGKPTSL